MHHIYVELLQYTKRHYFYSCVSQDNIAIIMKHEIWLTDQWQGFKGSSTCLSPPLTQPHIADMTVRKAHLTVKALDREFKHVLRKTNAYMLSWIGMDLSSFLNWGYYAPSVKWEWYHFLSPPFRLWTLQDRDHLVLYAKHCTNIMGP